MQDGKPSRTALVTALMRAAHTRLDPWLILDDPWGDRLVPPAFVEALRIRALREEGYDLHISPRAAQEALDRNLRSSAAYANVIVRSRFAEDILASARDRGCRQSVILGAGFDSYALRRPAAAADLVIVEIDHPATQGLKRERLAACGLDAGPLTFFLAADLAEETLDGVLARAPVQRDKPTFVSWLGVTMYLTRAANAATLAALASNLAPGSELVFNYAIEWAITVDGGHQADGDRLAEMNRRVAAAGEPFRAGFRPAEIASLLDQCGYDLLADITDADAVARYDPQGRNGFMPTGASHLVHARVR